MSKGIVCCVFLIVICVGFALIAQTAEIVEIKGKVTVKKAGARAWRPAKISTLIGQRDEIKTAKNSRCMIAFDDDCKNMLRLRENSHMRLDSGSSWEVFLLRGGMFFLAAGSSGVRPRSSLVVAPDQGGVSLEHNQGGTSIKCFEQVLNLEILDQGGFTSQEKSIFPGLGAFVSQDARRLEELFFLDQADYEQWTIFLKDISLVRQEKDEAAGFGLIKASAGIIKPLPADKKIFVNEVK